MLTPLGSRNKLTLQHFPHRGFPPETWKEASVTGLEHFCKFQKKTIRSKAQFYYKWCNRFTHSAFETITVPFLLKSNNGLRFDRFVTSVTSSSKQIGVALATVWVSIFLHERLISERFLAFLAHKVIFMPMDIQSLDDFLLEKFNISFKYSI